MVFLKRWIMGLDNISLREFLRLATGADVLIGNSVQVTFTSVLGFGRRPVFNTCGCVLELPSSYEDYCDFRHEFNCIISQNDVERTLVWAEMTSISSKNLFWNVVIVIEHFFQSWITMPDLEHVCLFIVLEVLLFSRTIHKTENVCCCTFAVN